jgi:Ca2+-binding RTX toxin-like protein
VLSPGATKDLVIADGATLKINAPGWSETIQLIRVAQAATSGSRLQTRQPEDGLQGKFGSLVVGGDGADVITGGFGWDIADGGAGNDLVKVGNGRDILCGGLGADELWGGFGWNTFRSEKDGSSDLLVIRSDQWLSNPRQNNTAGNNADGSKADVIEALDSIDRIVIQGCESSQISVRANASANGLSGIGIYAMGYLEALYIGGELTTTQLQLMATGDNSQGAIDNTVFSYRGEWSL